MLRTWVRYALKHYLCIENFMSVIAYKYGSEPPHHTVILSSVSHHFLKAELCYCYCLFRWRTQEPLLVASLPYPRPQPCLWPSSQTLHLPWACRDHATLTLAYPYKSLRTPKCPDVALICRARLTLCFDILGNNSWEINEGIQ